jgi:hypothetical protein
MALAINTEFSPDELSRPPARYADKLVNLIWDEHVTFAELSIDVIIWISIPNKTYDLKENFTVPPEGGITCLQKDECSAAHSRIF